MKILKRTIILFVLIVLCTALPAQEKSVESKWTATPVKIDGISTDWDMTALETEKKYEAAYAFRNDAYFLYALFVFHNPKYLSSIDFTGMTFWVNAEGKEKKSHGLRFYRKMATADQVIQEFERQGQILTEQRMQEIKAKPRYLLFVCDVVNKKGESVPHPGTGSGTFRMSKAEKTISYEFVIPLALLNDPASETKFDPAKPLKVGFEWGGMTDDMKRARMAQMGESASRGGMRDASMEEYLGGEGSTQFSAQGGDLSGMLKGPRKYDFWINLKIAQAVK